MKEAGGGGGGGGGGGVAPNFSAPVGHDIKCPPPPFLGSREDQICVP